jgi:hypothetical protein
MKILNEKIAGVMGWVYWYDIGKDFWIETDGKSFRLDLCNIAHAKLLQAKMVADGYEVVIFCYPLNYAFPFIVKARKAELDDWDFEQYEKSEPAAIVSLFCKVYSIADNGKGEIK